jgi:hypothetical protein
MIAFERMILNVTEFVDSYLVPNGLETISVRPDEGKKLSLVDICQVIPKSVTGINLLSLNAPNKECVISPRLIDFFWNETLRDFDLSPYKDDNTVLLRIQSG